MDWLIVVIIVIAAYFLFRSRKRPEVANFSVIPPHFVVVDIETTGLDPDKHQIIEIAAVKVNRDSSHHATLRGLVKIEGKIPEKIMEITGTTTEMLEQGGERLEAVITEFLQFIGEQRLAFAACARRPTAGGVV
jgi:DNA polymerase III epsilon subunit-like protein